MANVSPSIVDANTPTSGKVTLVTWANLTTTNSAGDPVSGAVNADRTVQIHGTFGVGGSIQFQGSLDGINWFPVTDPQGNAITKSAPWLEAVTEVTQFVRPIVQAGDGTTNVTVILLARGK